MIIMSVFKKQALVQSFPAYDIFERECASHGAVELTAGENLGLDSGKGFYREYTISSVVSYSLEYNECPIAAVDKAKERGHALYWINSCGAMLSASKQQKKNLISVHFGLKVRFEGKFFTIEKDHNNNLKLVEVAA